MSNKKTNKKANNIVNNNNNDTTDKTEKDDLSTLKDDFFADLDRESRVEDAIHVFRERSRNKAVPTTKKRKRKISNKLNIAFVIDYINGLSREVKRLIWVCVVSFLFLCLVIALFCDAKNSRDEIDVTTSGQFRKSVNKQIEELVNKYYTAVSTCDINMLADVMDSVGGLTPEKLKKQSEYIEKYENIKIFTKKGVHANEYVVYVYYENKIVNIDTLAPGGIVMYVMLNDDKDKYIIHNGIKDNDIADRIAELSKDDDVKKFNKSINDKLNEACEKDENLKNFYEALMSTTNEKQTAGEGETNPQETVAENQAAPEAAPEE